MKLTDDWAVFPGHHGYLVSSDGRVLSLAYKTPRLLGLSYDKDGYVLFKYRVDGKLKGSKLHRVVLELFRRAPVGPEVCNHINGDKKDNRIENLEWVSQAENTRHAYATGLSTLRKGEDCCLAKLSQKQVTEIRGGWASGLSKKRLAESFGVHEATIHRILTGKTWSPCS